MVEHRLVNSDSCSRAASSPPAAAPRLHFTDKLREFTDDQLPTIQYPSTDKHLPIFKHLPSDNKITDRLPFLSNINRPLKFPFRPTNRNPGKPNVIPTDITYISNYTDFDKSPD